MFTKCYQNFTASPKFTKMFPFQTNLSALSDTSKSTSPSSTKALGISSRNQRSQQLWMMKSGLTRSLWAQQNWEHSWKICPVMLTSQQYLPITPSELLASPTSTKLALKADTSCLFHPTDQRVQWKPTQRNVQKQRNTKCQMPLLTKLFPNKAGWKKQPLEMKRMTWISRTMYWNLSQLMNWMMISWANSWIKWRKCWPLKMLSHQKSNQCSQSMSWTLSTKLETGCPSHRYTFQTAMWPTTTSVPNKKRNRTKQTNHFQQFCDYLQTAISSVILLHLKFQRKL